MTQLNVNNVSADSTIRQEKKSHYFILCVTFKKTFFCQFAIFNHVFDGFGICRLQTSVCISVIYVLLLLSIIPYF